MALGFAEGRLSGACLLPLPLRILAAWVAEPLPEAAKEAEEELDLDFGKKKKKKVRPKSAVWPVPSGAVQKFPLTKQDWVCSVRPYVFTDP